MANLSEGSGIQLPTTAAAAAAQAAALQLNEAVPLGALNPVALTGGFGLGKGREWSGSGKKGCCVLTNSLCLSVPALSLALNLAPQAVTSQCFQLSSLFTPQTMVNQWHRTLLPCASRSCPSLFLICPPTAPSLHFVDQAILRAWTLIDSGGNRSHLRHQEELLPMAPLGMDPAEQRN